MFTQLKISREGFNVNLTLHDLSHDLRVAGTMTLAKEPGTSVRFTVSRESDEYVPTISVNGRHFKGKEAGYFWAAVDKAYKQAEWLASDMNAFERNPEVYLDQIQLYLDEKASEGVMMYLPLLPRSISANQAEEVLRKVVKSNLFGDLTDARNYTNAYDASLLVTLFDLAQIANGTKFEGGGRAEWLADCLKKVA